MTPIHELVVSCLKRNPELAQLEGCSITMRVHVQMAGLQIEIGWSQNGQLQHSSILYPQEEITEGGVESLFDDSAKRAISAWQRMSR